MDGIDNIRVEYSIEFKSDSIKSDDEFYIFVGGMARNAAVGTKKDINLNGIVADYEQVIHKCEAAFEIKQFDSNKRAGVCYIELPLINFDFDYGGLPLILGVIGGDVIGDPRIKDVKITEIAIPEEFTKGFKGPKIGLDRLRSDIFKLENRPLLAFTMKPRLGLDPNQHGKLCYEALKGGVDIAEDDERLVNPEYCSLEDRIQKCTGYAKKVEDEVGERKIYSINLTGRAEKVIDKFKELDKIAKRSSSHGIECIKIDVLPAGFSALQAISEFFHETDRDVIITVYPEMYYFYMKLFPREFIMQISRRCGADMMYAATPIIYEYFGRRGKVKSIDPDRLSKVKNKYYKDTLWDTKKFKKINKCMPTITGRVHPGAIELLYHFLGKNIGYFIGSAIITHPKGVREGARACRKALDGAVDGKNYQDMFDKKERLLLENVNMAYINPKEIIKKDPSLGEFLEVPLQ